VLKVLESAGLKSEDAIRENADALSVTPFSLVGRPQLEQFFNEHVIDIVRHEDRYKALGIGFPGAIALHGPPGCGKTFAVEKLVSYLGWPSYPIDASSIGSPYIHETSRKIAATFEEAVLHAPSTIVIDEMDAFLAERHSDTSGQHRVEEVAEFLRRLAEAPKGRVLVIGMTNRIDAIDPAVLRRGRFDHVIKVGMASEAEVATLLNSLITALPHEPDINTAAIAAKLADRPLSDVSFLVREAARRSARDGSDTLTNRNLMRVLAALEGEKSGRTARVGFL
jgi:SpoVK/Ycf46/Vps4 family AAA+-type ATPase